MTDSLDVDDLFKRKKRANGPGRKRKRQRHNAADWNEEENAVKVQVAEKNAKIDGNSEKTTSVNAKPTWKRVEYGNTAEDETAKNTLYSATAERQDVGGEGAKKLKTKSKSDFGPRGAPSHLRVSIRVDYQPDVCKDYKETGYCGFGDACKFLHDRSDYKAGWQLEKDWKAKQKLRQERIMRGEDPDAEPEKEAGEFDDDGLPFACFICRGKFSRPVETLCLHYFCEDCILKRMKIDPTCPICKAQLRGTLNTAHKLVAKMAR